MQGGPLSVGTNATLTLDNVALSGIDITDSGTISVSGPLTLTSSDTINGGVFSIFTGSAQAAPG